MEKRDNKAKIRRIELLGAIKYMRELGQTSSIPRQLIDKVTDKIGREIGQTQPVIEKRLAGLEAEDEFFLMALLLGNVEQITPLGQGQRVNWKKYAIPDFLMSVHIPKQFTNAKGPLLLQRFLVEVKSQSASSNDLILPVEQFSKLTKYGGLYTLPVYFAIKMRYQGSFQWFLISSVTLAQTSTRLKAGVRGKQEDCFSVRLVDMLKEDFSGLWLSNHSIIIPAGTKFRSIYSDSSDSPVTDPYGRLAKLEVTRGNTSKVIELHPGLGIETIIAIEGIQRLRVGVKKLVQTQEGKEVTYESDVDYSIPLFSLMAQTYFFLREKFEPHISSRPVSNPTARYFLDVFSEFDRSLAAGIRNMIGELSRDGLIVPIRMVPKRYFARKVADLPRGSAQSK